MQDPGRICLFDLAHKMTLIDQELQNHLLSLFFCIQVLAIDNFFQGRDKHNFEVATHDATAAEDALLSIAAA